MARPTNEELNSLREELEGLICSGNELTTSLQEHDSEFATSIATMAKQLAIASSSKEEIEALKQAAEESAVEITELQSTANTDYQDISMLALKSSEISESITSQELQLKELTKKAEKLKQTIEELLPGATSAGLASAFRERKESFRVPKILWGSVFVLSIIALLLVAYFDPISFEKVTLNHESIFPYILVRLPFAIPIVWLAIYAGRRHSQALRLEEDYAHKEVLSKSFEGYKTQLIEIESGSDEKEATLNLIERTLAALSLHPGRIYQGKHEDITPFHSLTSIFGRKKKPNSENKA